MPVHQFIERPQIARRGLAGLLDQVLNPEDLKRVIEKRRMLER